MFASATLQFTLFKSESTQMANEDLPNKIWRHVRTEAVL